MKATPPQFAYIDGVAFLKSDVARNENGTSAVLSLRHAIVVARLPVCRHYWAAQPNAGEIGLFLSCNLVRIAMRCVPLTPVG